MEQAYQRVLARESAHPQLLNDGLCRIASINENVFAPALAEVWTDPQQEKLVVFDRAVLNTLRIAERSGRLVRTQLRRTNGSRCIWSAALLPPANWRGDFTCVWCGADAKPVIEGWSCPTCHHLMPKSIAKVTHE